MTARKIAYSLVIATLMGAWYCAPWRLCRVQGNSMEPALQNGQWVLVERDYYRNHPPRRGEIALFRHDGALYVKRVAAAAGESLAMLVEGPPGASEMLWQVDGGEEARVRALTRRCSFLRLRQVRVPTGYFFALGDHVSYSMDSREMGPIDESALLGRVCPLFDGKSRPAGIRPATDGKKIFEF